MDAVDDAEGFGLDKGAYLAAQAAADAALSRVSPAEGEEALNPGWPWVVVAFPGGVFRFED